MWKERESAASMTPKIVKKKSSQTSSFVPALETTTAATPLRVADDSVVRLVSPKTTESATTPSVLVKPRMMYVTTPLKSGEPVARDTSSVPRSILPKCENRNLWTKPSIESMAGMTEQELARVEHFQIGQYGVGSVTWPGVTDVRYLKIDENLIRFKKGAVTLFPDETLKPPQGTGLNKTAVIELQVRPKNAELAKQFEEKYVDEMKKVTGKNGAEFLSYDLDTWRFRVEHFSTWGIDQLDWDRIEQGTVEKNNFAKIPQKTEKSENLSQISFFAKLDQQLYQDDTDEEEDTDFEIIAPQEESIENEAATDGYGALAVPPLTREELKALGWDLRICDLFLNQSFRVSVGHNNEIFTPEHPVLCESYKLMRVAAQETPETPFEEGILREILSGKRKNNPSPPLLPIYSLIEALAAESGGDQIHTSRFNAWLSEQNAKTIQTDSELSFNPASLLTTRDCSPSAAELLIAEGNPRLALVIQALGDETSRQIMKPQLEKIADNSKKDVYQILAGRCGEVSAKTLPDWKTQLAARYWFCEGDMTGFKAPEDSLEWKIIKTVILGNSSEIFKLLDQDNVSVVLLLAATLYIRDLKPQLVSGVHFGRIVKATADHILEHPKRFDWTLAVGVLNMLDPTPQRDALIQELETRHIQSA